VNRNVSSHVREVARDDADVTFGGRQIYLLNGFLSCVCFCVHYAYMWVKQLKWTWRCRW